MRVTVSLVLFYGICHFTLASNRLRFFKLVIKPNESDWDNAKKECNKNNNSLVTLYDKEDAKVIQRLIASNDPYNQYWLGLHRSPSSVSTWSDGSSVTFNLTNVTLTNEEQICEAIQNNTWTGFNCSDKKPFMCYSHDKYVLIETMKDWCQAHHYCRKHFTNLVSIRNQTQNDEVIKEGKNKTFWIGLMHDQWKWEDDSCSTFREWENLNNHYNCTQLRNAQLYQNYCNNAGKILCSEGSKRIKVVERNVNWEQAFDYCRAHSSRLLQIEDVRDQKAVEQWLNYSDNVSDSYWIGLRQSRVFGFWVWSDKTVVYDKWKDDRIPQMPMSNNCGTIRTADNYTWTDENCWHLHPFICEEDILYMKHDER